MGEPGLFHIDPIQRQRPLDGVLGGKWVAPRPSSLVQAFRENLQKLSGGGLGFEEPFSLIVRYGGLGEGFGSSNGQLLLRQMHSFNLKEHADCKEQNI